MLPPVLEIYVVWHPGDREGQAIADEFLQHFHGTVFSGLIGGAIEVYVRSAGWSYDGDAPRPIPFETNATPPGIRAAQFIAIVPILGTELAASVEKKKSPWQQYMQMIAAVQTAEPGRVGIFPYRLDAGAVNMTILGQIVSRVQCIAANEPTEGESLCSLRCRDLAQGIAQLVAPNANQRLTVFISHTKRNSPGEQENIGTLIETVRDVIRNTRLQEFFDASDLQPGKDWDPELRRRASTSALLAIRTDLYPTREWCQREILIAKREGMPVVIMDALGSAEERGSFLMDHVPRVPAREAEGKWRRSDIHRALNLLVDECLKRALWRHQSALAREELEYAIGWWAPHAPEPLTLIKWLNSERQANRIPTNGEPLLVLHPDPPLGTEEKSVLQEMLALAGINCKLDVMTPRILAARGG